MIYQTVQYTHDLNLAIQQYVAVSHGGWLWTTVRNFFGSCAPSFQLIDESPTHTAVRLNYVSASDQ